VPVPNPDHAWKLLSTTNEWIRHADAKSGVVLAFTGATSVALFNLAKGRSEWPWYLILVVVLAVASIFFTVLFVVATLTPRVSAETSKPHLENSDISVNPLFFGHISANYNNNDIRYTTVLSTLTSNPEELTNHIANQVHANSRIATTKMRYINTSIWCGLASVVFVAVLALTSGIGN